MRRITLGDSVYCAPVFADGVLYIARRDKLVAVVSEEPVSTEAAAAGGNWPPWRGPNRDNVSTETGLLQQWPEEEPPLVWRVEGMGQGITSVSIADGQIYTMTYANVIEFIVALDQATGNLRWAAPVGPSIGESRLIR